MMPQVWSDEKAASGLQVGLVCSGQFFAKLKNDPNIFNNQKARE
jgi:hypothetical protein